MTPLFCIGHRGASGEAPENTLYAIRRALEQGADGVEVDVHATCDGQLVVIHDATVDRTTDGCGPVAEMTLEAVRSLNAGGGEKVPTLWEVIRLVAGRAWLNIELKAKGTALRVVQEVERAVEELGARREAFTISSFDADELTLAAGRGIPIGVLDSGRRRGVNRLVRRLNATTLHLSRRVVNPRRVAFARAMGVRLLVYTVNEPDEMRRLAALGVDGIFTDFPGRMPEVFPNVASKMRHSGE